MMHYLRLFITVSITLIFVIFAITNREAVTVSLFPLPYATDMPLFLLAIFCFALGAIVAGLTMSLRLIKSRHQTAVEHKRVVALEKEIRNMERHKAPSPVARDARNFPLPHAGEG